MSGRHPTLQALAIRDVRVYLVARATSMLGHSLFRATLAWHIWKLTSSLALLGTLGLVEFLPVIPTSLFAGALADVADRRAIVIRTQAAALGVALVLAVAAGTGRGELVAILATAFGLAIALSFQAPAAIALLPRLVPPELFPPATVINASARNLATVSGPVVMGLVARAWGIAVCYVLCALCFAVAAVALTRLPPQRAEGGSAPSWASVREGLVFVRRQPVLLGAMGLDMFAVIFAGATAMLPVFADEILGVGELGYGLLSASLQIGTFLMTLVLLVMPPLVRPGRALLWAVFFFALATVVFGLSRSYALSVGAFILAGMADQVSMTARSILVQLSTPDALRGRVTAVSMIFIGASNELGAAESGYLAALTSATFSVVFGGCVALGVLGVVAWRVPELRRYRLDGG